MSMIETDWIQQINASINKHFDALRTTYALFIEGTKPSVPGFPAWAELRLNGPTFSENLKDQYRVSLSVDIMCSVKTDQDDAYLIHKVTGVFANAMNDFVIKNSDAEDWFCLKRDNQVKILQWGIVSGSVNTYSASVMAEYKGDFNVSN